MIAKRVNRPRQVIHSLDDLPLVCNAAEAGLLLRITPEGIAKLARSGDLHGWKQGQEWRFRRDDLEKYLDKVSGVTA